MGVLSNISVAQFRLLLAGLGLHCVRKKGGHEMWRRDGMTRTVVFQTHVDPVPEIVIRTNMRTLGLSRDEFVRLLQSES